MRILSTIYLKRGQWRTAEQTALDALATDDSEPANTLALYGILTKAYAKLSAGDKVWAYFAKHESLQSSWSNKNYQSSIREMEVKYETEKKETQIATLESEKKMMIWLGIAGGGVLLLTLAVSLMFWRWSVQKHRLAEQQVKQLEQEKRLVATQAVLDGEVQERTRLARDLHDGLGSILAGTKLNLLEMKKSVVMEYTDAERYETALGLLDESIREMRRVAHHLMPESLVNMGLKHSITDFCRTIPHAQFNYYGDESRIDPKLEVMLYRIMHELVSNALKHSGAGYILVEITRYENKIVLTVHDNGCGFDASNVTQGMGLANIRNRVSAHNGNLIIDSNKGKGTEINVELRITNND